MKYHFIEAPQTVQYDVLHAIESGSTSNRLIHTRLCELGRTFTIKQIQSATGRLYKDGIIQRINGLWVLCTSNRIRRVRKVRAGADAVRPRGVLAFYRAVGTQVWKELEAPYDGMNAASTIEGVSISRALSQLTDSDGDKFTVAYVFGGGLGKEDFAAHRALIESILAEYGAVIATMG